MTMIKVLLADDQNLFAESLKTLIHTYADDITVVGICKNGNEVFDFLKKTNVDVILMDVRMPEVDGVEATKIVCQDYPNIRVMMLSTFDEDEYVQEALHFGASGYLLKDISPTELIASIRAINEGAVQISPSIANKLVDQIYYKDDELKSGIDWYKLLNKREKEIFRLISKGYSNKQISSELFIAEQTVRNYVSSIYLKLDVENRFQIIQMANELDKNLR